MHQTNLLQSGIECGSFLRLTVGVFEPEASAEQASVEVRPPTLLRGAALLAIHAYGLVLIAPVGVAMLLMTLFPTGIWPVLFPLLALSFTALFLPFGLGNQHIRRLLLRKFPDLDERHGFIVQATFSPRLHGGLRSILEDADDIGLLSFSHGGLAFEGDRVSLRIPWTELEVIESQNIGLRGLFVYGSALVVEPRSLRGFDCVEFAERSSYLLSASRRITRQLREASVRYFLDQRGSRTCSSAKLDFGN
jgi:hypothetical protein